MDFDVKCSYFCRGVVYASATQIVIHGPLLTPLFGLHFLQ